MRRTASGLFTIATLFWAAGGRVPARELTFEQRVAAQEAIERVRYAHQMGAELPFEVAVPRKALEAKVRAYLGRQGTLTPCMLHEEALRMTRSSAMPERLREIQAALGNDPFLFEECVVRPALLDRLTPARSGGGDEALACLPDDTWSNGALANIAPLSSRTGYTAVWTGNVMIVWGGNSTDASTLENTGSMYDPALDHWSPMSSAGAPVARYTHSAVWTGTEMIVWGGRITIPGVTTNEGGRYNPVSDSWLATQTSGAPTARANHAAFWTGSRMLVWGGDSNTGGRYDPVANTWAVTNTANAPSVGGGFPPPPVWTGSEMIVWNAFGTGSGGRYNPSTNTWVTISTVGAPTGRRYYSAVWSGAAMIVYGGQTTASPIHSLNTGSAYDPVTDSWAAVAPSVNARDHHLATWTGHEMIVWAGLTESVAQAVGERYAPGSDSWTGVSQVNAPQGGRSSVWSGSFLLVWGSGVDGKRGGRYVLGQMVDDDGDGFTECAGDCNDGNASIHPGAFDACDHLDNDCDGNVDVNAVQCCPGATEVCDGMDNDCDTSVDEAVEVCDGVDNDCDTFVDEDLAPPGPVQGLSMPTLTAIVWQAAVAGESWDLIKGSLAALRQGGGDFAGSALACLMNNNSSSATATDPVTTAPGQGFYYLVRSRQCGQDGTYDDGSATLLAPRDPALAGAPNTCP